MTFESAISTIKSILKDAGTTIDTATYDGLIVKRLAASNTLDDGRTTNQTHIAITGEQMDIFPYLCADGYFYEGNQLADVDLKKYFVISIPVTLFKSNVEHLGYDGTSILFSDGKVESCTTVVRSKRNNQADQIQVSMIDMDGEDFVSFRKLMKTGCYFVLLKCKHSMKYHAFGVQPGLISNGADLAELNNKFFKCATSTVVKSESFKPTTEYAASHGVCSITENCNVDPSFGDIHTSIVRDSQLPDLTEEDLGKILLDMYTKPKSGKSNAVRMFGLKYGEVITTKGYTAKSIRDLAGLQDTEYDKEIAKGIAIYKSIAANEYGVSFSKILSTNLAKMGLTERTPRISHVFPMNFIVYGAPGTGKTYSMVEYALAIIDKTPIAEFRRTNTDRKENVSRYKSLVKSGRIVFTTFHQNYGYEEFIQGLRPDKDSSDITFKTVDGIFKTIADRALNDSGENDYVIIIDEINRANISKVFGELITLIEEDKRWGEINETCATLQSGDLFAVPNNLFIIGTMNSADKSISLIDAALRRRFDFVEQKPNSFLVPEGKLRLLFESLNKNLAAELESTDLLIGHSYFMNKTEDDLISILNNNIIPLLYEYFYDNRKKIASVLQKAIDKSDVNLEIIDDSIGRLKVDIKS